MISLLKSLLFGSGQSVDAAEANRLIAAGAPVVDVREPQEFAAGAIPGAINVPLSQVQQRGIEALRSAGVAVDAPAIILVCRSGARSGSACSALRSSLDTRARNLSGGVMAWGSHGLPLTPGGKGGMTS